MFRIQEILKKTCNNREDVVKLHQEQLSQLQNHLLEMYKDLEQVCKNHNLQICLAYGNVIGAIRHNGWIPWDDDLDVVMPRKDYNELVTKYFNELPEKYILYSCETQAGPIARFPKLIDTTTVYQSILDLAPKHHEGVFIDIFILDNVSNFNIVHKAKNIITLGLMFIANSVNQTQNLTDIYKELLCSSPKGKKAFKLRQIIGKLFGFIPLRTWYKWINTIIQKNQKSEFIFCGEDSGIGWKPLPFSMIFPAREYILSNGTKVNIPRDYISFLNETYNDWKTIPNDDDKWQHYVNSFKIPSKT